MAPKLHASRDSVAAIFERSKTPFSLAYTTVADGASKHTAFQIEVSVPKDAYKAGAHSVCHRYSRFVALHEALTKQWGKNVLLPRLPAKKYVLGGLSAAQIEERRLGLEQYLVQLVRVLNWAVEPNIRLFFECDRWLKERRTRAVGQ